MEPSKPVLILDSLVFCDPSQTTFLPILIYLASFYKTREILPHVCFIVFSLAHMGLILLYQFVNLLKRFGICDFHPNFLLDWIDSAIFANYLAFYGVHSRPGACLIDKRLVLDADNLRNVCYHCTAGL